MTTAASVSPLGETALQKEQERFNELFPRLRDAFLNRIFDLKPHRAARRLRYLIFLFLLSGFLITLTNENYALSQWARHLQDIFWYLLIPSYAADYQGSPFVNFVSFAWRAFTDPHTLQYLPVFLAPFFIALQSAAIYLADIFELEEVRVARSFVWEVALSGSDETIRISQGEIAEKYRQSPNYLIGGPGKVVVDLDSVAVFERADGTPHIIGPTGKELGGKATLEGFERFRQAVDLRDHFIDLRDQDEKSPSVKSRSLDGIPITATDVRLVFSVYRDGRKPTAEHPYPFSKKSIEQIVYQATSRVTPDLANPSTYEFSWISNMMGLVRGELGGFMSQRGLTEYLASIGTPEVERLRQQEDEIRQEIRFFNPPNAGLQSVPTIPPAPPFTPRHQISDLFNEFANKFTEKTRNRGVELRWIGIGTWKTPLESIPEQHLGAWRLRSENIIQLATRPILGEDVRVQELSQLIQEILLRFGDLTSRNLDREEIITELLQAYKSQIKLAWDLFTRRNTFPPVFLREALRFLNRLLAHFV